jgi:mannose-6-phosphate isomerase
MNELLRFQPLYQERVWGGSALADALGRSLPSRRPIGESWEIVDRPEAQSIVASGAFAGRTLREVIERAGAEVMGPSYPVDRPFPVLVKWLDCRERLSLQVHPPGDIAAALRGEPKTENWYIAATQPGAALIIGLKRGVRRGDFAKALVDQSLERCLHRFAVNEGDSILVESGTLHAIDAGNLILEIQQNSDTTYRVYDWGRVGLDGKPRQMHVAESLASIRWDDFEPQPVRAARVEADIAAPREFRIRRVPLGAGERWTRPAGEQPRIVSVVQGRIASAGQTLNRGDNVLVPFVVPLELVAREMSVVLVTEAFA